MKYHILDNLELNKCICVLIKHFSSFYYNKVFTVCYQFSLNVLTSEAYTVHSVEVLL